MDKKQLMAYAVKTLMQSGYRLIETGGVAQNLKAKGLPGMPDVIGRSPSGRFIGLQFESATELQAAWIANLNATAHGKAALIKTPFDVAAFINDDNG